MPKAFNTGMTTNRLQSIFLLHSFSGDGIGWQRGDQMNRFQFSDAIARVRGGSKYPRLNGVVRFYQQQGGVLVAAEVTGLPKTDTGFFGCHIHEGRDCGGRNFENTGSHFSSVSVGHPMHAGDLPPLLGNEGRASLQVLTNRFRVEDIIGRTVIIHSQPDDFHTQPSGNAGEKIACGVIRRQ